MAQDLVRNAQKNPHIPAKELQKRVATHRSRSTLNNIRPTWQSCQKECFQHKIKHLKYAKENMRSLKPFGTMCFGLTKPKLNFLATTKENVW